MTQLEQTKTEPMKTVTNDIEFKIPEPFLGRMVLEIEVIDPETYKKQQYGLDKDSPLVLANGEFNEEAGYVRVKQFNSVPYKKGKIIKMAPDCYGERFCRYYGNDVGNYPKMGDVVWFIYQQSYILDPAGKYHMVCSDHIIGKE